MADPLSIIGFVVQAIDVATELYRYGKEVKDAHNEIRELFGELFALKAILEQIEKNQQDALVYDSHSPQSMSLKPFQDALTEASTVLKEILDDLESRREKGTSVWRHLAWPERKARLKENIMLERLKTYFILAMMNDRSWASGKEMASSIDLLTDMGKEMKMNNQRELERKVNDWICPVDVESTHRRALSLLQSGTGRWFINGPFRQWFFGTDGSRLLYLQGRSGSGKTVLCATAIEEAQKVVKNLKQSRVHVVYFYCSFQHNASQSLVNLLGAILAQLSHSFPEISGELNTYFQRKSPPTPDNLIQLLLKYGSRTDGILKSLMTIMERAHNVYVMATSTSPPSAPGNIQLLKETMKPSSNRDDIRAFVNPQLELQPALRRLPSQTKVHISKLLTFKSDGMFRYVRCQIDLLSVQKTGRGVIRALEVMPEDLNGTYEVILSRISSYDRDLAREALLWLTYSQQALTLPALNEALVLEKGDKYLDDEYRIFNPDAVLEICQGLVVFDEANSVVTLAHSSVKTFLTSDAIQHGPAAFFALEETEATRHIIQKCLTYLMFDAFQAPCANHRQMKERIAQFPLYECAAEAWGLLCGAQAPTGFKLTSSELDEIIAFISSGNFRSWIQILLRDANDEATWETQPLYYASSFGMLSVVDRLIKTGADVDAIGGRNGATALTVAAYRRQLPVVKRLLEAGADPDVEDECGMTNIDWATHLEWDEITTLLSKYGAKARPQSWSFDGKLELSHIHWSCCSCKSVTDLRSSAGRCRNCEHGICETCTMEEVRDHLPRTNS
ncbi:putative ankyrin repeat-containing protein [Aspergillus sclerotiicarbonarius CBS 121057]|uniref:Putative ankyrin repeat-containing protein n=1 Tax=Aspergillus sclerotiicarbonarius (strain CBS 121057 / IBT 28362) TaxID=1448318 RepID=A0A319E8F4_ASPSB|nr:putative ankyrin repeat-containing protein [Aspergillus sclerotiicarbonarius CBS 121057]